MNEEQFIEKYCDLIPKALKSCYIFTFNPNYEDYKQIAYEALIRSYHQHPIATASYYFTAIKWRIQDEKYRQQKEVSHHCHWHDEYDVLFESPIVISEPEAIRRCLPQLTEFQIHILNFYLHKQETLSSFLKRHHCTRSHFYDERKSLISTLKNNLYQ